MVQFPEEPLHLTAKDGYGYFPAYPRMKLDNGRFEIVRKLGWGPRKSVWMARDTSRSLNKRNAYVALAIMTEHESKLGIEKANYLSIAHIQRLDVGHMLGSFTLETGDKPSDIDGAHGSVTIPGIHECLIFPLGGESLNVLRSHSPTGALSVAHVKTIILKLTDMLYRFHEKSIVHGAVSLDNLLIPLGYSRSFNQTFPIDSWETVHGVRYPIVRSRPVLSEECWDGCLYTFLHGGLTFANAGHLQVLHPNNGPVRCKEYQRMPRAIRPPEVILNLPYTTQADIWQLGCALFHLLLGEAFVPDEMAVDDETLLGWNISMCGPVPPEMVAQSDVASTLLNAPGTQSVLNAHDACAIAQMAFLLTSLETGVTLFPVGPLLEARIRDKGVIPIEELQDVIWFLEACLEVNPERRVSSEYMWDTDWLPRREASWP